MARPTSNSYRALEIPNEPGRDQVVNEANDRLDYFVCYKGKLYLPAGRIEEDRSLT